MKYKIVKLVSKKHIGIDSIKIGAIVFNFENNSYLY